MNRKPFLPLAALAALACSNGPAGPGEPQISFTVTAPTEVSSKAVVDVETNVIVARGVQFPLTVTFEKANAGESFLEVGSYVLGEGERIAVARIPVLLDPEIRVTVRESSAARFSVSKTIQIDVVDFP